MRVPGGIHENGKNPSITEDTCMYKERCVNCVELVHHQNEALKLLSIPDSNSYAEVNFECEVVLM
jgi:hypothetical protein